MKIYPSFASKAGGQRCMRSMLPMEMAVFVWAVLVYFTVKWREIGLPTLWQPSLINLIDWHFGETFYFHWLETDFRWLQQMFSPKGVAPPESVLPCGCLSLELHNVTETHKQVEKEMVGISLINLNDSWFSVRSWPTPDFISQELKARRVAAAPAWKKSRNDLSPSTCEAPLLSALSTRWHPRGEFGLPNAVLGSEIVIVAGSKNEEWIHLDGWQKQKGQAGGFLPAPAAILLEYISLRGIFLLVWDEEGESSALIPVQCLPSWDGAFDSSSRQD